MISQFYKAVLFFVCIIIWLNMYWARQAEYDQNYGYFIYSMLLSIGLCITITVFWIRKRSVLKQNMMITLASLIIASPVSILVFIYIYQALFGLYFKL